MPSLKAAYEHDYHEYLLHLFLVKGLVDTPIGPSCTHNCDCGQTVWPSKKALTIFDCTNFTALTPWLWVAPSIINCMAMISLPWPLTKSSWKSTLTVDHHFDHRRSQLWVQDQLWPPLASVRCQLTTWLQHQFKTDHCLGNLLPNLSSIKQLRESKRM